MAGDLVRSDIRPEVMQAGCARQDPVFPAALGLPVQRDLLWWEKSVGKSPAMPYWGLMIGQQGVADVMKYIKYKFKCKPQVTKVERKDRPLSVCEQPRQTRKAPGKFVKMEHLLPPSKATIRAGKTLFQQTAKPLACAQCHGPNGDGQGPLGAALVPPPRNFTCGSMMQDLPDGQLCVPWQKATQPPSPLIFQGSGGSC